MDEAIFTELLLIEYARWRETIGDPVIAMEYAVSDATAAVGVLREVADHE